MILVVVSNLLVTLAMTLVVVATHLDGIPAIVVGSIALLLSVVALGFAWCGWRQTRSGGAS